MGGWVFIFKSKIKLKVSPDDRRWNEVFEFLNQNFENIDIDESQKKKLYLACEEIHTNISKHAYKLHPGEVKIKFKYLPEEQCIHVTFVDSGPKFNPLEMKNPIVSGSAEKRKIGGLGIFMVKHLMDKIEYKYESSKNRLKLIKSISTHKN